MRDNALSRSVGQIPAWVVQALLGVMLTSGVAWATWSTVTSWRHEVRISTTEDRVETTKDSITEIKASQRRVEDKLDRIIESQSKPQLYGR